MSDPENQAEPVRQAVRAYAALQPRLASATQAYVALIQVLLDDAGIDYLSVTGRTKSVASFAAIAMPTVWGLPSTTRSWMVERVL
jgi:hypothetical protein